MTGETVSRHKGFITLFTQKMILSSMQTFVALKIARMIKGFVTYVTRVRSLTSVNKFVIFEITTLSEAFAAYLTFK